MPAVNDAIKPVVVKIRTHIEKIQALVKADEVDEKLINLELCYALKLLDKLDGQEISEVIE